MNVEICGNFIVHAVQKLLNKNQLCKDTQLRFINVLLNKFIRTTQNYNCPTVSCKRVYKLKTSLNNHLKFECGGQRRFQCHLCPKNFAQKVTWKNHLAIIHKVIR